MTGVLGKTLNLRVIVTRRYLLTQMRGKVNLEAAVVLPLLLQLILQLVWVKSDDLCEGHGNEGIVGCTLTQIGGLTSVAFVLNTKAEFYD